MNDKDAACFLALLQAGIAGNKAVPRGKEGDPGDRDKVFHLAEIHAVYPIAAEAFMESAGPAGQVPESMAEIREKARSIVIHQAQKTADFLLFYEYLKKQGLHPLVMKGIICRNLYPQPEQRASVDEDLLINPAQFRRLHKAITDYGLSLADPKQDLETSDEISYKGKTNHLYIEVHKTPFPRNSKAYGDLNRYFDKAFERAEETEASETIYGTKFYTLEPSDHLLYLILHALKHFLYSGFGIRQVCDIILFSERYRDQIDWSRICAELEECRALEFTYAIYRIADKYLLTKNHIREYLSGRDFDAVDEAPLLEDILEGGLYGTVTMSRVHSSNMTLHAVEKGNSSEKKKRDGSTLLYSVFLPLKKMESHYPYLKKAPLLLPVAWAERIISYTREIKKQSSDNKITDTIRLGRERVRLLEKYHII